MRRIWEEVGQHIHSQMIDQQMELKRKFKKKRGYQASQAGIRQRNHETYMEKGQTTMTDTDNTGQGRVTATERMNNWGRHSTSPVT